MNKRLLDKRAKQLCLQYVETLSKEHSIPRVMIFTSWSDVHQDWKRIFYALAKRSDPAAGIRQLLDSGL